MTAAERAHQPRTIVDYLTIVRRRKWALVLPLVIVPIVAYAYSARQPAVYAGSSEVLLSRQDLGTALSGIPNADIYTDPDRFAQTQAAIARVPEVARQAVKLSGVSGISAGQLLANSSVSPKGNADLLEFIVKNENAVAAGKLATAYAQAFTEYRVHLDTAALSTARQDLEKSLSALERQGATDTQLYRTLAQKAEELRTMELLQTRAAVVRPSGPGGQVAPTPARNAVLGIMFGLLLGSAIVFLWEALDRRVRDEEELGQILSIPLLARLPAPKRPGLAMMDNPSDVDAEAVRRLRSSIEFANLDVNAKAIMVTSAVAQEGKTTTIANLAVALARAGHRVALVDLDLRQPAIASLFGLELRPGLADVAIERLTLDQALVPIPIVPSRHSRGRRNVVGLGGRAAPLAGADLEEDSEGSLYVLPAGFLPASPGELVGTQAVAHILVSLEEKMDFVLVDSPPILTVSDASTLSARVDAIFLVIRLGTVDRSMLNDLVRQLEASPARKLGFALTGAEAGDGYGARTYGGARTAQGRERESRVRVADAVVEDIGVRGGQASEVDPDSPQGLRIRGGGDSA